MKVSITLWLLFLGVSTSLNALGETAKFPPERIVDFKTAGLGHACMLLGTNRWYRVNEPCTNTIEKACSFSLKNCKFSLTGAHTAQGGYAFTVSHPKNKNSENLQKEVKTLKDMIRKLKTRINSIGVGNSVVNQDIVKVNEQIKLIETISDALNVNKSETGNYGN
jgi:hypothetical protein